MFQAEATDLAKILDFDATAVNPMNLARTKGSKLTEKSRF